MKIFRIYFICRKPSCMRTDDLKVTKSEGPTDDASVQNVTHFPELTPRSSVFVENLIHIRSSASK